MSEMDKAIYDSKPALPNKLLKEDGTITDLAGNSTIGAVDAYENKPALPNKWLNPDGSYSTLNEIVASLIDSDIFIIVDELPATGETNKIYLLTQDDKLIEYLWVNNAWDPVGMVEFDINNYYTKAEVTQLISASLDSAKTYTDQKVKPQVFYWVRHLPITQNDLDFWNNVRNINKTAPVVVVIRETISTNKYRICYGYADVNEIENGIKCYATLPDTTSGGSAEVYSIREFVTRNITFTVVNDEITAIAIGSGAVSLNYLDAVAKPLGTGVYVPTQDYHPANKKYVDDSISASITSALQGSY